MDKPRPRGSTGSILGTFGNRRRRGAANISPVRRPRHHPIPTPDSDSPTLEFMRENYAIAQGEKARWPHRGNVSRNTRGAGQGPGRGEIGDRGVVWLVRLTRFLHREKLWSSAKKLLPKARPGWRGRPGSPAVMAAGPARVWNPNVRGQSPAGMEPSHRHAPCPRWRFLTPLNWLQNHT